jgi:hypothetical protein
MLCDVHAALDEFHQSLQTDVENAGLDLSGADAQNSNFVMASKKRPVQMESE